MFFSIFCFLAVLAVISATECKYSVDINGRRSFNSKGQKIDGLFDCAAYSDAPSQLNVTITSSLSTKYAVYKQTYPGKYISLGLFMTVKAGEKTTHQFGLGMGGSGCNITMFSSEAEHGLDELDMLLWA